MSLWLADKPLVLASKSEARRRMLKAAGIPFVAKPANIDERAVEKRLKARSPRMVAAVLAREKAIAVSDKMPGRFVVGADQTLALGNKRFSKPANRAEARAHLRALSGKTHELFSAVTIARNGKSLSTRTASARLTMRKLSKPFIERYLDEIGSAATKSVGGYQIEGLGIHLFERIEGNYFTILGLPLLPLLDYLGRSHLIAE